MLLTILTPTYNRAHELRSLWFSLQKQDCKEFEWLVVDDGSLDDTREVVRSFQPESSFNIRYLFKSNGGKHTAINLGVESIASELTFIVDSDDCLVSDAVSSVLAIHEKYRNRNDICGYSFLRMYPDGKINGKLFAADELIGSYINVRINSDDTHADKAEVFKTACLREFPFPVYPGERFLGEDIVWVRMARKYDMVHVNKAIYIGSYLENGLTNNRRKNNTSSPVGCMHRAEEFMCKDIRLRYRVKGVMQYIIYGRFSGLGSFHLANQSSSKFLVLLCLIPGSILYHRWSRNYKNAC